jgi:hypothetical protein
MRWVVDLPRPVPARAQDYGAGGECCWIRAAKRSMESGTTVSPIRIKLGVIGPKAIAFHEDLHAGDDLLFLDHFHEGIGLAFVQECLDGLL